MLSLDSIVAYCALAALQGALVAVQRPARAAAYDRLRSPAWALVLPGALLVGTFGVLAVPGSATGLAVLAAVAMPLLVGLAMLDVVRGPRLLWFAALPVVATVAVTLHAWPGQLAAAVLTGLGCLTIGAALVRLTPLPWLAAGIAAMCVTDVVLLGTGVGQPAAAELGAALSNGGIPDFHRVKLGSMSKDYPDVVLAAVLGAAVAGSAHRLTAAVLVTLMVCANGVFLAVADMLPGTVPVALAAVVVALLELRGRTFQRSSRRQRRRAAVLMRLELVPER